MPPLLIHNWAASGKIGEEPPDLPNNQGGHGEYLADAEARHLAPETVRDSLNHGSNNRRALARLVW
jgi:hypothetical protein